MLHPEKSFDRESVRQAYRTGRQWKVLIASTVLAICALGTVAIVLTG